MGVVRNSLTLLFHLIYIQQLTQGGQRVVTCTLPQVLRARLGKGKPTRPRRKTVCQLSPRCSQQSLLNVNVASYSIVHLIS